jgi:D-alanyl-D-alanine dipeptidase
MKHCLYGLALALCACVSTGPATTRVDAGTDVFHVTPVRPIAELLPIALATKPPAESGTFRASDLVELTIVLGT